MLTKNYASKKNLTFWIVFCTCGILPPSFAEEVVVYTSVDQIFSEPILRDFEKKTGIKVKALYDVEASKTVGLANRLLAEKRRPKADVFWNSEVSRTIVLANKGVLTPYQSPHWRNFPATFKDEQCHWTGFGARARILIYHIKMIEEKKLPKSIFELVKPKWKGKVTIAYPLFGTTAMHVAALYAVVGKEKTEAFLNGLVKNEVVVVNGNAVTRDLVVEGRIPIGFTDTDDANVAMTRREPVNTLYPDKEGMGGFPDEQRGVPDDSRDHPSACDPTCHFGGHSRICLCHHQFRGA